MACCIPTVAWADGVSDVSCAAVEDGQEEVVSPMVGFWREESLFSVSENQPGFRTNVHYKFYTDLDVVSLYVSYNDGGDKNMSFSGQWGMHGYLSDTAVMEGGDTMRIKMKDADNFNLWWSQMTARGEQTYREGWTRTFVPMGISEVMERTLPGKGDSKFTGLWQRKWLRQPVSGELIEAKELYYKLYGDGYFILYMIEASRPDRSVSFNGRTGTFEAVSDTEIKENGGDGLPIKWLDDNTFELSWFNGVGMVVEVWSRVEPSEKYLDLRRKMEAVRLMKPSSGWENAFSDKVVDAPDVMAVFPGGNQALVQYILQNLRYPEACLKKKIEGRALVRFVIDRDGQVTNPELVNSLDSRLGEEAIRVIKSMPRWTPARKDGFVVAQQMMLPVNFRLK